MPRISRKFPCRDHEGPGVACKIGISHGMSGRRSCMCLQITPYSSVPVAGNFMGVQFSDLRCPIPIPWQRSLHQYSGLGFPGRSP